VANNTTQRPWILDTPSTTVPVKAGKTWTTGFVFRDYTGGAASAAVFKDSRGLVICRLPGNASGTPVGEAWFWPQVVNGLLLSALDSGVVEVIIK
jgi:hypothetical protein